MTILRVKKRKAYGERKFISVYWNTFKELLRVGGDLFYHITDYVFPEELLYSRGGGAS